MGGKAAAEGAAEAAKSETVAMKETGAEEEERKEVRGTVGAGWEGAEVA